MRIPNSEYTDRPWRIHEFTEDFEVEDVWELPTPGGPAELDRFVRGFTAGDDDMSGFVIRNLFAIRWKLGSLLGLDKESTGLGKRVQTLRSRLPDDLRNGSRGRDFETVPFVAVYQTDTEYVAELANRTVHALMHIGWVADGNGGYHGQMTALVKPQWAPRKGLHGRDQTHSAHAGVPGANPVDREGMAPVHLTGGPSGSPG